MHKTAGFMHVKAWLGEKPYVFWVNDMQLTFPISAPLQIKLLQDKPRLLTDTPVADEDEESAGEMTDGELYLNSVYPVL